jgi:hypothetical protein
MEAKDRTHELAHHVVARQVEACEAGHHYEDDGESGALDALGEPLLAVAVAVAVAVVVRDRHEIPHRLIALPT